MSEPADGPDPEALLRALMKVDPREVRWHIVVAATGDVVPPPNPGDGFATEDEAVDFMAKLYPNDDRLEVRPVRLP